MSELPDHTTPRPDSGIEGSIGGSIPGLSAVSSAVNSALGLAMAVRNSGYVVDLKNYLRDFLTLFDGTYESVGTMENAGTMNIFMDSYLTMLVSEGQNLIDAWDKGIRNDSGSGLANWRNATEGYDQLKQLYLGLKQNISLLPRITRYYNSVYLPYKPDLRANYELWLRGKISGPELQTRASRSGYDYNALTNLKDAWATYPSFQQAFRMFQRGLITFNDLSLAVNQTGLCSPYLENVIKAMYVEPDPHLAFEMMCKGQLTRAQFDDNVNRNGWAPEWSERLNQAFSRELNLYEALEVFHREESGFIPMPGDHQAYYLDRAKRLGYTQNDAMFLLALSWKVPNLRELTRISDQIELPDAYVRKCLRSQGYQEGDIDYLAPVIEQRANRDEARNVRARYLWDYQTGRCTRDQLITGLDATGILPTEKEYLLVWGDLRYQDELMDKKLAIVEHRCMKKDPALNTEASIKAEILTIGFNDETSNLLAEDYYYHYIYSPGP